MRMVLTLLLRTGDGPISSCDEMLTHSGLGVNLRDAGVWIDLLAAVMTTSAKALQLSLVRMRT